MTNKQDNTKLPKQTVAQAFVIWRVPQRMPISKEMLLRNIKQDIEDSDEQHGFVFSEYSRRASAERTLKFVLERSLLTEAAGLISRNDRTVRYVKKLPKKVVELIDQLPVCDPLILLAGAGD